MELANFSNNLLDPASELLFLDHPRFYDTATPAHRRVAANPEIDRHLRQRPVTTPPYQVHRHFVRLVLLPSLPH